MVNTRRWMSVLTILGTVLCLWFIFFLAKEGYLLEPVRFQNFLMRSGAWAPLLFMSLQIIQTVIPVIPGGMTSAIGVVCFGGFWGFVYNYIGLCIGSLIAFWLVKRYGQPFIQKVSDPAHYDKYIGWLDKGKKFEYFFAFAILVPGFPDDILCMIAGLTKMSYQKFMLIILTCKPLGLFLYSNGLMWAIQWVASLF